MTLLLDDTTRAALLDRVALVRERIAALPPFPGPALPSQVLPARGRNNSKG